MIAFDCFYKIMRLCLVFLSSKKSNLHYARRNTSKRVMHGEAQLCYLVPRKPNTVLKNYRNCSERFATVFDLTGPAALGENPRSPAPEAMSITIMPTGCHILVLSLFHKSRKS